MYKYLILSVCFLFLFNCKSSEEFTGFSYDPPNVTDTQDKKVHPQHRRIIGAGNPVVWVSNNFESARLSDFYAINDSTFEVFIEPENAPINNSPWYAFKIWSDSTRSAVIRLNYNNARHRYVPKISTDDSTYTVDMNKAVYDSALKTLDFQVNLSKEPITVSAQPISNTKSFDDWLMKMSQHSYASISEIGVSKLGNPIKELTINETDPNSKAGVLIIMSRQHPPEVSGYYAARYFIEELISDSELSKQFRSEFIVRSFPLINVDGVINGHWRHSAAGIDLNRDWENFNQPETRAVKDALLPLLQDPMKTVYYGIDFHSTNENIFYPIEQSVKTFPDDLTQRWTPFIQQDNESVKFVTEEFDTTSPISKNWIYKTFGADAVTFEMSDELPLETIEQVGRSAARSLMKLLLDEKSKVQ
ncbi:MAG: M14 family metallopeptidase [Balneola sp.]